MKQKLSRAVAALLTLAMAFSVLAVPASAAGDGNTYTAEEVANAAQAAGLVWFDNDLNIYRIIPKAYCVDTTDPQNPKSMADATETEWGQYVLAQLENDTSAMTFTSDLPADAVEGYWAMGYGQTIWLSAADQAAVEAAVEAAQESDPTAQRSLDWQTGEVKVGDTAISTITSRRVLTNEEAAAAKALISEEWYEEELGYSISSIFTKESVLASWPDDCNEQTDKTEPLTDDEAWAEAVRHNFRWHGYTIYAGDVPADAIYGLQKADTKQVIWFSEADQEKISEIEFELEENEEEEVVDVNWETGVFTVNGTEVETLTTRINAENQEKDALAGNTDNGNGTEEETTTSIKKENPEKDAPAAAKADDSGTTLLIAGGAVVAVAAGVGFYLYTHPAVVQKIKNFFAGNSAAQQPAQAVEESAEAAAESEAAAENAAEQPAEAEQAA